MGKQGKAGVQVRTRGKVKEITFYGMINGVSQQMAVTRLVEPTTEELNAVVMETITYLRAQSAR